MDFKSAVSFLDSLNSYERWMPTGYRDEDFDLQKFRRFLDFSGIDNTGLKFIHVAGSKGKGTVCRLINDYLVRKGFRVGLYASPHVYDIRERILINGNLIEPDRFAAEVDFFKQKLKEFEGELTYFEVLTAMMFRVFVGERVDFAVVETGLGGRLDATNVIDQKVAVITKIEKEHSDILGESLAEIVKEKLGIVKGNPVVVGPQSKVVLSIIERFLKGNGGSVFVEEGGSGFEQNVKTAREVLKLELGEVDEVLFVWVCESFRMPGRFECLNVEGKDVVFDIAHTPSSISDLLNKVCEKYPDRKIKLLLALMKDKEAAKIAEIVNEFGAKVFVTEVDVERSFKAGDLAEYFSGVGGIFTDAKVGFEELIEKIGANDVLVVTGSVYLLNKFQKIPL